MPTTGTREAEPTSRLTRPLWRLKEFTTADEARPALLGCLGAMLITAGGLGAGSTRLHDPLLESLHLSWLRFGHGLVFSSVLLWGGVAVMLFAWLWLGRRVADRKADEYTMMATTWFWLAPLLLSVPVFSRDTYSYLAQGALLRDGFDPYAGGPDREPEHPAGQRQSDLDDDDRAVRPGIHHGCQVRDHARRRQRHRRHHGAAAVHAARIGACWYGRHRASPAISAPTARWHCGSAPSTRW